MQAFRVLRVLRVLRPLRLMSRSSGMRTAIGMLLKAMPRVLDVVVVFLLFLAVFAILGVQLLAGRLGRCATNMGRRVDGDTHPLTRAQCEDGTHPDKLWSNPSFGSFDNFGSAALLLFEVATLEGWVEVMWASVDATDIDMPAVRDFSPMMSIFFLLWVVLGSVLLLNLFVGVLVTAVGGRTLTSHPLAFHISP